MYPKERGVETKSISRVVSMAYRSFASYSCRQNHGVLKNATPVIACQGGPNATDRKFTRLTCTVNA